MFPLWFHDYLNFLKCFIVEFCWMNQLTHLMAHNLQRSVLCYEAAIEAVSVNRTQNPSLSHEPYTKRLGNVLNELGVQYMNHSANVMSDAGLLAEKQLFISKYIESCL